MTLADNPSGHDALLDYSASLDADRGLAMSEMGRFFEGDSKVHRALQRVTSRLEELRIPYALVGGMALNAHGYRRTTDDIDLLVTAANLKRIHESLDGLGYVPPFAGSKQLRDVQEGVRIEFLVTDGFPGDGRPKAVAFPDPSDHVTLINGLRVLSLEKIIELKLASGMSLASRLKDLADVQELAKMIPLDAAFAERLDPSVRDKFRELVESLDDA